MILRLRNRKGRITAKGFEYESAGAFRSTLTYGEEETIENMDVGDKATLGGGFVVERLEDPDEQAISD